MPHSNQIPLAATWSMQIVLVLYKVNLLESAAYQSLTEALAGTGLQSRTDLLVCDNSPLPQTADALHALRGEYVHQPENPGLAASYNLALNHAASAHAPWLMLLDQDTALSVDYLQEAFSIAEHHLQDSSVVALAPRLMQHGHLHSPQSTVAGNQTPDFCGRAAGTLRVFNSGAVLRTSALQNIGGFPRQFWLDFLDHATFHLLQQRGRVVVLPVTLQHELFTNTAVKGWDRTYLQRHRNLLQAEAAFYRLYGTRRERWLYRLRLLRHTYGSLKHLRLPLVWQLLVTLIRGQ